MQRHRHAATGNRALGALFALGVPAGLVNIALSERVRDHVSVLSIAMLDLGLIVVSIVVWFAPWSRLSHRADLAVLVMGSLATTATIYVYGDTGSGAPVSGTVAYVVFSTLWLGFSQPPWSATTLGPLAAFPVLLTDAHVNGTQNVATGVGMFVMSVIAAEGIARSRRREQGLTDQLARVVALARDFDMTVAPETLREHIATVVERGLGATVIMGPVSAPQGGARAESGSSRTIEVCVDPGNREPVAFVVALSEPMSTKAIEAIKLVLGDIVARFVDQHETVAQRLRTDPLTGLGNRVAADDALERLKPGDALLLIDVDNFKNVNDTFGHASGDAILQQVAGFLRAQLRSTDDLCRMGGDEMLVVLRDCADPAVASRAILERWAGQGPPVTLSAGLAVRAVDEGARSTLARADSALYDAKKSGRARLCAS